MILPSLKDGLLRRLSGDLTDSGGLRWVSVGEVVVTAVVDIFAGIFVGGTISPSMEHTAPRLSRHVGHSFTKREMSSFGTL